MDLQRRRLSDRLLERALQRETGQRFAFIERECGGDEALESFVLRLLDLAEPSPDEPLVASNRLVPANQLVRELVDDYRARAAVASGTRVGPYRVLREIGRGGMGVVYQGERCDGYFDQTVALKLLPRGWETRDAIDRFERERQILAGLSHPNIAHLLDGGITSDGVPYYAMEYVRGSCIDEYCDERRLSLDERLRLFLVAARAVDFANSQLITHGDIKPTNLHVTSTGDVKLLDFGIAKLVPGDDPDAARTRTRILTPEYASPEQVLGEPVAIASDVYQLGLLLYELLTGRRAQPVAGSTPAAFEQAVCHQEPASPSTRWSDEEASRQARARSTTPAAARRKLQGDLDNIVMKALRKEPERRYRSVSWLIDDIERFQNRRPVLARPDTWAYRARKFVVRHGIGLAGVAGIAALLIAYAVTVTLQSYWLAEERDRTRLEAIKSAQVKDFLLRALTAENPSLSELPRPTTTDLLEDMARAVRGSSSLDPLVRAELLSATGETFRKLDHYDEARGAFAEAAALRATHLPPGHLDHTLEEFEMGLMAWELRLSDEARPLFESVIERRRRALGGVDDLLTIRASGLLATVLYNQGHYEQAIATMREAIARRERTACEGLPYSPRLWANLGFMLASKGDLKAGEAALHRAIDLARAGAAPPSTSRACTRIWRRR